MANTLDRFLNAYSLFIINLIIIGLALTVGGGLYFFETSLIHLIALIFIALAVLRIGRRISTRSCCWSRAYSPPLRS